jgi:hypothetical protein
MKLWHDDIREAPDDTWTVARTNEAALLLLRTGEVTEASLDHDLGFAEDGRELATAMAGQGLIPPVVNIHSWNPSGAEHMALTLRDGGAELVTINPCEYI